MTERVTNKLAPDMLVEVAQADDGFWPAADDWRAAYRPYVVSRGVLQIPVKGVLLNGFSFALGSYATGYTYITRALQRGFEDGRGAFAKSTVARKIAEGDMAAAADAFLMWNKAGGSVVPGLVNRRKAEREQFLRPDAPLVASAAAPKPPVAPAVTVRPTAPAEALPASRPGILARAWAKLTGKAA